MNLTKKGELVRIPPGKYLKIDSKTWIDFSDRKLGLVVKAHPQSEGQQGFVLLIDGERILVWDDQIRK
tara:strand:- start:581 stop:784 length:204 start_codon:yes stop_codon:yes gene_type:complete